MQSHMPTSTGGSAAPATSGRPGPDGPWDEFLQHLHRQYQELPRRQFPQVKAHFLREALRGLINLEETQKFETGANEEQLERAVARILKRLASISDLSAVMVAILYESVKRSGDL